MPVRGLSFSSLKGPLRMDVVDCGKTRVVLLRSTRLVPQDIGLQQRSRSRSSLHQDDPVPNAPGTRNTAWPNFMRLNCMLRSSWLSYLMITLSMGVVRLVRFKVRVLHLIGPGPATDRDPMKLQPLEKLKNSLVVQDKQ